MIRRNDLKGKRFLDAKKNLDKISERIKPFSNKGYYLKVSTSGKWKPEMDSSVNIKKL